MEKLISIRNLKYLIPYTGVILDDVNIDIGPKEFVGVLGHNGSGKTTLLDLIMGYKASKTGVISVLGDGTYSSERKNKDKIAFISQDVTLKGNLSIRAFLDFHSKFYDSYSKAEEKNLLAILELDQHQTIGSLSTGQQKKVQFVATLATIPQLIIIDEVTAVLDPVGRSLFFQQLLRFRDEFNSSIVLATNIAEDLPGIADRILFIKDHKITEVNPLEVMNLFKQASAA